MMNSFKNVILLIYFNHKHLIYLKDFYIKLYGGFFKKIFFISNCNHPEEQGFLNEMFYIYTQYGDNLNRIFPPFYQMYKSELENSDGLMFVIDDCIINMKLLNNYTNDKIIFNMFPSEIKTLDKHSGWQWDRPYEGKEAIYRMLEDKDYYMNFHIKNFTGCFSDRFYLPKKYLNDKTFLLFHLCAKHSVYFELSLPTIILTIEDDLEMYQSIKEEVLWGEDRNTRFANKEYLKESLIDKNNFAIHPVRSHTYPEINEWLLEFFL